MTRPYESDSLLSPKDRIYVETVGLFLTHWRGSLLAVSLLTIAVVYIWWDFLPSHSRLIWCISVFGNYVAQAYVSWRMESDASLDRAILRYMPWLLFSVTFSSVAWGSMPWLLYPNMNQVLFYVSLFNLMLVFCIVHAPSTTIMAICAVIPLILLNSSALAVRSDLIYAGYYLALGFLVLAYGLRVQSAINDTIMERLIAKDLSEKLASNQQQLLKVERERTLLLERQRLMYDMHDGFGSTLLTTLAAIELNQMPQETLAATLRECVEDLRLMVDSLEPIDQNLINLLATIRYRLGPRLDAAGLTLEWSISDLPELPWLEPPEALNVLRIIQEALVNVLKHAKADRVRVTTRDLGGQVEIHIEDNGCGFDYSNIVMGRGLRSQNWRAEKMGAELLLDSTFGSGTSLRLRLPLVRGGVVE